MNFELKQTATEIDNSEVPRFIFHEIQHLTQKLPESKHSNGLISDKNVRKPLGKCSANNVTSSLSWEYTLFACGNGLLHYVAKSTISPSPCSGVNCLQKTILSREEGIIHTFLVFSRGYLRSSNCITNSAQNEYISLVDTMAFIHVFSLSRVSSSCNWLIFHALEFDVSDDKKAVMTTDKSLKWLLLFKTCIFVHMLISVSPPNTAYFNFILHKT